MKLVKVTQWRVPDPVVGSRMEGEKFCDGWFGFEEECFSSSIHMTILNGDVVFRRECQQKSLKVGASNLRNCSTLPFPY